MLELKIFSPGMVYANCYIVKDEESGDAFVVDPGSYTKRLEAVLSEMKIENLRYILLTHGHFDHIEGVKKLKENYGGEIVIHSEEADCLHDKKKSLASKFFFIQNSVNADKLLSDGDRLPFGDGEIEVIHTPGHTRGSVCYLMSDMMFSGDTLFRNTVGRTDFPGGSFEELKSSLEKLSLLETDYKVYPGHDVSTTLSAEKKQNPYFI